MNVWFLSVFMWLNGAWVAGENIESGGWSPRQYESEKILRVETGFFDEVHRKIKGSRSKGDSDLLGL